MGAATMSRRRRPARPRRGRGAWAEYERRKAILSRLYGWDAPAERFDQDRYERAVVALARELGL